MIYGHDEPHPASGAPRGEARPARSGKSWKDLDSERRLAMIEFALGHHRQAA